MRLCPFPLPLVSSFISVPSVATAALAEILFREWEKRPPQAAAATATTRQRVLSQLTELTILLLTTSPPAIQANSEDARFILQQAFSVGIGSTAASGPDQATRAAHLVATATQAHLLGPEPPCPATVALLTITSHPRAELEVTEMLTIINYLKHNLLNPATETIFGHGQQLDLSADEIHVCLLIGCAPGY